MKQDHMTAWLASYPRSGNTFARIALATAFGIRSRAVYPDRFADLIGGVFPESAQLEILEQTFTKTHELPAGDMRPAIYIIRDGRDALISYAHFIQQWEYDESSHPDPELFLRILQNLIVGKERFGGWSGHARSWTERNATTKVIHFENLIHDPIKELRGAFSALGEAPNVQMDYIPTFDTLHSLAPRFFRSGRVGAWRTEMPPYLQALFWNLHGDVMKSFGYHEEGCSHADLNSRDLERAVTLITEQVHRAEALESASAAKAAAIRERDALIAHLATAAAERLAGMEDRDRIIAEIHTAASERLSALLAIDAELKRTRAQLQEAEDARGILNPGEDGARTT